MKNLKDLIVFESNDTNYDKEKVLSAKLYNKIIENNRKRHNEPVDCTGRKIDLGDIVLFGDGGIIPLVVTDILQNGELKVWDTSRGKSDLIDCASVFKLDDPKKYL